MLTPEQEYRIWNRLSAEDREEYSQLSPAEREDYANQIWIADEVVRRNPEWEDIGTEANAKLLTQAVEQAVDKGAAYNADTVSACFHYLNAAGKFDREDEPGAPIDGYNKIEHLAATAHQLSDAELERELLKAGIYVSSRATI